MPLGTPRSDAKPWKLGRARLLRELGPEAVDVWQALKTVSERVSGKAATKEMKSSVFGLALKGFQLHRRGDLTTARLAPLGGHVERALREAIHSCENDGDCDPLPLCGSLRELHDVLLETLRPLFSEGFVNPKNALRLTNTFIHFGSETFLRELLNSDFQDERAVIAQSLRALLSARGVEVEEKERPEVGPGARVFFVEGRRCASSEAARAALRAALSQRNLGCFLCDPKRRALFQTFLASSSHVGLLPVLQFHVALAEFRQCGSAKLRGSRAQTICSKFLHCEGASSILKFLPRDTATTLHRSISVKNEVPRDFFLPVEEETSPLLDLVFKREFRPSPEYQEYRERLERQLAALDGRVGQPKGAEEKSGAEEAIRHLEGKSGAESKK